ncbi:MAG: S1/P1 nuclease [Proteobacteria bacterium]|nr:S1/P1 nuclease [Pseudomonadota bacterium]
MIRRRFLASGMAVAALLLPAGTAQAWSERTHQTTGAIAWADLKTRHPAELGELLAILRAHPDYPRFAPFAAQLAPATRERALFEFLARWSDDIRKGPEDHPDWHYELRVVSGRTWLWPFRNGNASSAFARNYARLADRCAPAAERAKAIGWLIHIVGDVQQPLHAGHAMTAQFSATDRAGSIAFVRRAPDMPAVNLHSYWDSMLEDGAPPAPGGDWATALLRQWPRARIAGLEPAGTATARFATYLDESATLAGSVAYRGTFLRATAQPASAPVVSPAENRAALALVERRVATGGYRIADVLTAALAEARAKSGTCQP